MSVAGDGAAASDAASGSDVFMLYVCFLDDSDLNSISRRCIPLPIFFPMFACAFEQSLAKLAFDGVPQSLHKFITQVVRPEPGRLLRDQVRDGADVMPIAMRLTPRPTRHDLVSVRSSKVAATAMANMVNLR